MTHRFTGKAIPAAPRAWVMSCMFCTAQLVAASSSHSGCSFDGFAYRSMSQSTKAVESDWQVLPVFALYGLFEVFQLMQCLGMLRKQLKNGDACVVSSALPVA